MNEYNLMATYYEKYKVYNKKLLEKRVNTALLLSSLNYLNATELTYDIKSFEIMGELADKNNDFSDSLSHKTKLNNYILHINSNNVAESESTEITSDLQTSLRSAAVLDLIATQLKTCPTFYLNYKLDHRLRIYCYP